MSLAIGLSKTLGMLVLIGFSTFILESCVPEHYRQNRRTAIDGGSGAVAGGPIGGIIEGRSDQTGTGIIIGSLQGALAGTAIGQYVYNEWRSEEAAQRYYVYSYKQTKATLVIIEEAFAIPSSVMPGGAIDLSTTYTVLCPQRGATMEVIETREIRNNGGELIGKTQVTVQRQGGTYTSRVPLTLSAYALEGTYFVYATIHSNSSNDSKKFSFTVQKGSFATPRQQF